MKRVQHRQAAERDIEAAIAHYLAEAPAAALAFADALQLVYSRIQRFPASGSPRYAHELGIPALRCAPLGEFPYLVFYVEQPAAIDVWRVLHMHRDIPAWMGDVPDDGSRISEPVPSYDEEPA